VSYITGIFVFYTVPLPRLLGTDRSLGLNLVGAEMEMMQKMQMGFCENENR
jgi:hypothetical protein